MLTSKLVFPKLNPKTIKEAGVECRCQQRLVLCADVLVLVQTDHLRKHATAPAGTNNNNDR